MKEYSKEQLWELYEQLPEDLQKAVFSEEIGQKIESILEASNIKTQQKILIIIKNVGYVFLGLLLPEELKESILKKELKIKSDSAEKIFSAINSEIFWNLKDSLEALYGIKLEKQTAPAKSKKSPKKDIYRELIS